MRIIGGRRKGKILLSPADKSVRPTTDRVKENIYNILQFKIKDAAVLDLFSGSGAMGIEALSRGAARVVFCDSSAESANLTAKNLASIGESAEIYNCDYKKAVEKAAKEKMRFDIAFIDPPYFKGIGEAAVKLIFGSGIMAEEGVAVFEYAAEDTEAESFLKGTEYSADIRKYGNTKIAFIKKI